MTKRTACIIGSTSSLGTVLCRTLAAQGCNLLLCARDADMLARQEADIRISSEVTVKTVRCDFSTDFDATDIAQHMQQCDTVFMLSGTMGDGSNTTPKAITQMMQVNLTAPMQLIEAIASYMRMRGSGAIVIISSVAGDRGRQSNYIYGTAKAGLSAFAGGLRNQLYGTGIHVMTVKPGFMDTPMTWGMNSPLIASRESVVNAILEGMEKRKDVLYVPWFWRYIMLMIRSVPERLFKRLSL